MHNKREIYIKKRSNASEQLFWNLFFAEIDKRDFIFATFKVNEFGVHIHNSQLFNSKNGVYSLMYTRYGQFKMNKKSFNGNKWDAIKRMEYWCNDTNIPKKFYSQLNKFVLLDFKSEWIDIERLALHKHESEIDDLICKLFKCFDLFKS